MDNISLRFGGVIAIDSVTFEVREGELFAIIGPNGAGKTSIFNSISQVYRPQSGDIRWKGDSIMGLRPDRVARLGVARTFQNIELFSHMTVLDNLLTGRHVRMSTSLLSGRAVGGPGQARGDRAPAQSRGHHRLLGDRRVAQASRGAAALRGAEGGSSWAGRWPWTPSC